MPEPQMSATEATSFLSYHMQLVNREHVYMPYLKHLGSFRIDTSYPMHEPLESFPIIPLWEAIKMFKGHIERLLRKHLSGIFRCPL